MLDGCTLIFSAFLFTIGFLGCLIEQKNIIKTILSIELMILASVINFCYINEYDIIRIGYIFSVAAIIISGIILGIIFAMRVHGEVKDNLNE